MRFTDPSWREHPLHTTARVGESIVRRRVARLRYPVVDVGYNLRIHADLNSALGLRLFRYGIREPEVILLERLLSPGDTFVDGGAHIGVFALIAARLVGPAGKVIAFEPAFAAANALEASVRLNSLRWLQVHRQALADVVGETRFFEYSGDAAAMSSLAPTTEQSGMSRLIEVTTLDEVLAGEPAHFVKLDLEGAEARALVGGEFLLSEAKPDLLLEIEPEHLKHQGSSSDDIDRLLARHGYTLFELCSDSTPRMRRLARSADRRPGPNVFATAYPGRLKGAGLEVIS